MDVSIDVSNTQILVTLLEDQQPALVEYIRFTDVFNTLPPFASIPVTLNPASTWAGFQPSDIVANPDILFLTLNGLPGLAGQFVLVDIVPEPVSAGLLAVGAVLAAGRRRSRQRGGKGVRNQIEFGSRHLCSAPLL
jgi:hypothetical protein